MSPLRCPLNILVESLRPKNYVNTKISTNLFLSKGLSEGVIFPAALFRVDIWEVRKQKRNKFHIMEAKTHLSKCVAI